VLIDELRIVGSTQTNVVMHAELVRVAQRALHRRPPEPRKEGLGQLVYPFDAELAWAATTYLRTPTRVVWDVYRSHAQRLEPLYDELVADIRGDTRRFGRDGDGISVEARRVEEFAAGERQIVGTVKNALIDGAARRGVRWHVDAQRPAQLWVARLDEAGDLVVSIDLGGGSLSQRGWRRDAGEAPLREHLAAALIMLARFDPRRDALVDPMCGSGTIPIEAVLAARGVPRDAPALRALALRGPSPPPAKPEPLFGDAAPLVVGCDHDIGVLGHAKTNARAAGVTADITWQRADVAQLRPETIAAIAAERGRAAPESGVLLSNPPYGERLDADDLGPLYHDIARAASRFRGWRAAFLVASPLFERVVSEVLGQARIKKPLANANLRAYFFLWDL
jgi:23S rRNA G2445 N2-methylase RlmL